MKTILIWKVLVWIGLITAPLAIYSLTPPDIMHGILRVGGIVFLQMLAASLVRGFMKRLK